MTKDEALKLALEAIEFVHDTGDTQTFDMCYAKPALAAIKKALAQPEQEPVAWMFQHEETGRMNYVSNDVIHDPTMFLGMNPRYALVCPLYTTPPQRTWVGLTDDEIKAFDTWHDNREEEVGWCNPSEIVAYIEAKLKEKNGIKE